MRRRAAAGAPSDARNKMAETLTTDSGLSSRAWSDSPDKPLRGTQQVRDVRASDAENALAQWPEEEVAAMGRAFAEKYGLPNDDDVFGRAAALARDPRNFGRIGLLTDADRAACEEEVEHPWRIPRKLVHVVAASAMSAAVQGMDETVINGANLFYPRALGLGGGTVREDWLIGLVNGAPYLCCAVAACWLTDWANNVFGRKRVIFLTCFLSGLFCLLQGVGPAGSAGWRYLFAMRFLLGFGLGIKSATVNVYLAECSPKELRGIVCMNWQAFTAFGVMCGYVASLVFYRVGDAGIAGGLNWRLMLASAALPAVFVLFQIPYCPESPRWLMGKGRYQDAYAALLQLRNHRILACRDLFYQHVLLVQESTLEMSYFTRLKEIFTVRRNRNAFIAAFICAFMQQFCAINVIAYYSSVIFLQAGFSEIASLCSSLGFGIINTVFAIPAYFMIDRFGRRFLLLSTLPWLGVFLLVTGFAFWIKDTQTSVGVISFGIYVFSAIYSFGMGVVPFVYAGEVFPLYVRAIGSSLFAVVLWGFNFILALTWPSMLRAMKPQGAFGFYAAWNFIGYFLVYFFLPETKQLTLEELDEVFDVPLMKRADYYLSQMWPDFQETVLRKKHVKRPPPLVQERLHLLSTGASTRKPSVDHVEHV
ncbi:AaceriAGL277Wp [[Ashbya] aceris (nom. inval.)]|nr:AaceriAGL277Wp [[Ashbya] aceris (nom. inval.)]